MITALLLDKVLKLVQVRRDEHSTTKVARIYDPRAAEPEAIYKEIKPNSNIFHDELTGRRFHLTPTGLIGI